MTKFKETLSNNICLPVVLTIGFVGWFCKIDFITIPLLCLYAGLVLAFCDDIRNIFAVIFSVQFFINKIEKFSDYVVLGIGVLLFIIGVIVYLVRKLKIEKASAKKGKLFWPFVVALIAYLLGGLWGYFNLLNAVIITAMTSITYFLYWIAINFTQDLKKYLQGLFISLGIVLALQLLISYAYVDEKFSIAILSKNVIWIGLQNINVVAIYFMLAMFAVFQMAPRHKYDYLITLAGMLFAICTYFTYCRMGTLVCFVLMCAGIVYIFVKSRNKVIFIFMSLVEIFLVDTIYVLSPEKIEKLLNHYLTYGFSGNGRDTLWPWCLEKFIHNPIFGVGFTSTDPVPTVTTDNIIMAHNSLLQYLTSLGIVGTILIGYYYIERGKVVFTKFNEFKFMNMMSLLCIVLSGITDQAPTMDIFILCISTLLVSLAEMDTEEILAKENANNGHSLSDTINENHIENSTHTTPNTTNSNNINSDTTNTTIDHSTTNNNAITTEKSTIDTTTNNNANAKQMSPKGTKQGKK